MSSKKFGMLLIGFLLLLSTGGFAQDSNVYNIYDSSVIPNKGLAQQNEFMNNNYDFPAKPRNQIEFGLSGGMFTINGDVNAKMFTPGFAVHFRKALGYLFSLRLQYMYGVGKGQNWVPSQGYASNYAWVNNGYNPASTPVYYNYRTHLQDLSLQGLFSLNNIRFHNHKTSMLVYMGLGGGLTISDTKVNALNGNSPYNFSSISGFL